MSRRCGLAVDVGTTTLVLELVDLDTGDVVATTSRANPQDCFGSDVVTRIARAQNSPDIVAALHAVLIEAIERTLTDLLGTADVSRQQVSAAVLVGNATMMHTLVGLDPTALGVTPYRGVLERGWQGPAAALGIELPAATAYVPPGIRSHVGADTVAAMLAARLDHAAASTLLVDLGTNSEIVLVHGGQMLCTSAAAGPAFERPATEGRLRGSQLITAVAERLASGAINASGRLHAPDASITQEEIRQLQLAKAGVAAAIRVLCARLKLREEQIESVAVAGAFGSYLDKNSALAIGLLPRVAAERVRFLGNAAVAGARLLLTDEGARRRAQDVAARAKYIELGGHRRYAAAFVEEIGFPAPRAQLMATLSQLATNIAGQSRLRCPYRAARDVCTFRGPCRNRIRVQAHLVRCGGGPLNSNPA